LCSKYLIEPAHFSIKEKWHFRGIGWEAIARPPKVCCGTRVRSNLRFGLFRLVIAWRDLQGEHVATSSSI